MPRQWFASVALGALALCLAGCSAGNLAFGITYADVAGTWTATDDLETTLTLADDGTLAASGWPTAIGCDGGRASDVEELRGWERRDLTGEWDASPDLQKVWLAFDADTCTRGGPILWVWRDGDGDLSLCAKIPGLSVLSDNLVHDQVFVLRKGETSAPAAGACL